MLKKRLEIYYFDTNDSLQEKLQVNDKADMAQLKDKC